MDIRKYLIDEYKALLELQIERADILEDLGRALERTEARLNAIVIHNKRAEMDDYYLAEMVAEELTGGVSVYGQGTNQGALTGETKC